MLRIKESSEKLKIKIFRIFKTRNKGNAYNCFITAAIYVVVLIFSAWQGTVNAKLNAE